MNLHSYIPTFLFIIYLIIFISSFRISTKSEESFLNFEFTTQMRGLAILAIVFHHVINMLYFNRLPSDSYIQWVFNVFAPLGVALFLFFSGYGNSLSIKKKGNSSWIKNRILKLYIPTLIVILIAFFGALVFNLTSLFPKSYSLLKDIICLTQPPFMSWYLKVQLFAYITLYLFWVYFKRFYMFFFIIFWVLFVIFCIATGKQGCWWISTLCLPLGVLCAEQKQLLSKIIKLKPYYYSILALVVCLFLSCLLLLFHIKEIKILPICITVVLCICLCLTIIPFGYVINLKSRILNFLGVYSLEIYLVHLCCISIFEKLTFINHDIKIGLTIIITVVTVKALKTLSDALLNKMMKGC